MRNTALPLAALALVLALGACAGGAPEPALPPTPTAAAPSPSPSPLPSPSPTPTAAPQGSPAPRSTPSPTPTPTLHPNKMMQSFLMAALHRDIPALEGMAFPVFLEEGGLSYWGGVRISDGSWRKRPSDDRFVYDVQLDVDSAGDTLLAEGTGAYVVEIETDGYGEERYIACLAPAGRYLTWEQITGDPAAREVMLLRGWDVLEPFSSPEEIDTDRLVDYLLIRGSRDFGAGPEARLYELTQEQLDATAARYFGMESAVRTQSRYYDAAKGKYVLAGRGSGLRNERIVSVEPGADGEKMVTVELYSDPLQLQLYQALRYTLRPHGDGTYYTVSAQIIQGGGE